jgi:hypothetical protein
MILLATGLIALVALTVPLFGDGAGAAQSLGAPVIVTGAGPGGGPNVRVFSNSGGAMLANFFAYGPTFPGGVHVTTGDFDGNGRREIVTAPGQGGAPTIRIFNIDGSDTGILFNAYNSDFMGGVWVAAGDVNNDGRAELITGAGPGGGPDVRGWAIDVGKKLVTQIGSFFAYGPFFPGGARVATSDLFGTGNNAQPDGRDEILTGPGPGGGPDVQTWEFNGPNQIQAKGGGYVYGSTFTGGVFVGGDSPQGHDILTGAGAGGGPHVKAINSQDLFPAGFFAYDAGFTGGVSVAGGDVAGDGSPRVITGAGPGGGPNVRVFKPDGSAMTANFFAYDGGFTGGVYVAFGRQNPPPPTTTTTINPCVTTTTSSTTTSTSTTTTTAPTTTTTSGGTTTTSGATTTTTSGATTTTTSGATTTTGGLPTILPTTTTACTTTTTAAPTTTTTHAPTTTTTVAATTTTAGATTTTACPTAPVCP